MKVILLLALSLLPALAHAHGSVAKQSSDAILAATELFQRSQTPDVRRQFYSISATLAGHERFAVEISLKDRSQLKYDCRENEAVNPVVWECAAI